MDNESSAAKIGILIMDFINALKDKNLSWQEETEDRRNDLQSKRKLSAEQIAHEVQRLKVEFQHEIQRKEHDFQVDMRKRKSRAEDEIQNYQRFLDAIEELREKLEEFYPNMPSALVLVIHEYVTQLLHKMWEAPDGREKLAHRLKLVDFLALVSEDTSPTALQAEQQGIRSLPSRTLEHIRKQ